MVYRITGMYIMQPLILIPTEIYPWKRHILLYPKQASIFSDSTAFLT